jgi:transcriptional regulator with XRE-family HTH domain
MLASVNPKTYPEQPCHDPPKALLFAVSMVPEGRTFPISGAYLRARRKALGRPQRRIADDAGIKLVTYKGYERASVSNVFADSLAGLARALEVGIEDLRRSTSETGAPLTVTFVSGKTLTIDAELAGHFADRARAVGVLPAQYSAAVVSVALQSPLEGVPAEVVEKVRADLYRKATPRRAKGGIASVNSGDVADEGATRALLAAQVPLDEPARRERPLRKPKKRTV